jgi:hypothetical protein
VVAARVAPMGMSSLSSTQHRVGLRVSAVNVDRRRTRLDRGGRADR